jgi:hypothetical protein
MPRSIAVTQPQQQQLPPHYARAINVHGQVVFPSTVSEPHIVAIFQRMGIAEMFFDMTPTPQGTAINLNESCVPTPEDLTALLDILLGRSRHVGVVVKKGGPDFVIGPIHIANARKSGLLVATTFKTIEDDDCLFLKSATDPWQMTK